ncbi:hypothetical protein BV898_02327 [Hypsibius exemplaris]|uniref:Chitin-binding type-2 domain-containing protein n=1 Tax=Hypsibius exemplaris TaxID=2072580 RepID=A0A1W0X9N9_HYPEX|nr:hypothetical protein BV898_02327 [Hypsibius exemplaris]
MSRLTAVLFLGLIAVCKGQYYACQGVLYTYPFGGCTYASLTANSAVTYYSCNGLLYSYAFAGCTYPAFSTSSTVTGTTTTTNYLCNGVLYTFPTTLCTYPSIGTGGTVTGTLTATSGTGLLGPLATSATAAANVYYSCNGYIYTYAYGGCVYNNFG